MVWFNLVLVMLLSHFFYQSSAFTILLNKPVNTVTSHSDNEDIAQCRQTVYELLPQELVEKGKFHACGRLDVKTSGLLILTTDTKLVHYVTHPQEDASSKLWKYYEALGMGHIEESDIQRLREGVDLQGSLGISHPARVELLSYSTEGKKKTKLKIGIAQGKNRQIRRMLHSIGSGVMELCRVQISRGNRGTARVGLTLVGIEQQGDWRPLSPEEIDKELGYPAVGVGPVVSSSAREQAKRTGKKDYKVRRARRSR